MAAIAPPPERPRSGSVIDPQASRARPRRFTGTAGLAAAAIAALVSTLAGFAWRIRDLGAQSLWWDEAYSAVVARGSVREIVAAIASADFHPPLHYALLHYWRLLAGEGEYALRYPSVAAGTL